MKKTEDISFQEISSIPKLIKDFLDGKIPEFKPFHYSEEHVRDRIEERKQTFSSPKRKILSEVLRAQHSCLQLSENQITNLELISKDKTFTVTTGHQLNLFTGPVFFIYKILQTIKLAEDFRNFFPEYHFVPVFWMATEDHDFEEINHFRTEDHYYEISAKRGGAVGRIIIEDTAFTDAFEKDFKDSVFGTELILMMKKSYQKGRTLSEATRILVQELFADFGLLILDGDTPSLKAEMKNIFNNELFENQLLRTTKPKVDLLKNQYGKVQVNPREINLFYLSETRNRIEKNGDVFRIVDTEITFSEEEMMKEFQEHPERFSPNALMRPVYQETVLPNLCYIGGNAEVMYWLELPDYFKKTGLPFPVLIPRNSMLFISEKTFKKIGKFHLEIKDFFQNLATLTKDLILGGSDIMEAIEEKEKQLHQIFQELKTEASKTEKTFYNLVSAEETRQQKSFEKMKKRLLRAEKIKKAEQLENLETLFQTVHPFGNWQERVYNFSVFYADEGRDWLQNCYSEMQAEKSEMIIFLL